MVLAVLFLKKPLQLKLTPKHPDCQVSNCAQSINSGCDGIFSDRRRLRGVAGTGGAQKVRPDHAESEGQFMAFYSDLSIPIETKKKPGEWQNLLIELDQLKSM